MVVKSYNHLGTIINKSLILAMDKNNIYKELTICLQYLKKR